VTHATRAAGLKKGSRKPGFRKRRQAFASFPSRLVGGDNFLIANPGAEGIEKDSNAFGINAVALVGPEVSFKIAKLGFEEISRLTIAVHTLYDPKDG
jgi:hypothetical protein